MWGRVIRLVRLLPLFVVLLLVSCFSAQADDSGVDSRLAGVVQGLAGFLERGLDQ